MNKDLSKTPRLFVELPLKKGAEISLDADHTHYLKNVLRRQVEDDLRLFNGADGEFHAEIMEISKKSTKVCVLDQIKPQPKDEVEVILYFAPIKKNRLDMLIEKTVELGVTKLCPVMTARTENRHLNLERIKKQVIEASEQCERLTIPSIDEPMQLHELPEGQAIFWAIERQNAQSLSALEPPVSWAFLIGPEGGFDPKECKTLAARSNIKPISLGQRILRAETAAIVCLASTLLRV